jgi:hypothetical protein
LSINIRRNVAYLSASALDNRLAVGVDARIPDLSIIAKLRCKIPRLMRGHPPFRRRSRSDQFCCCEGNRIPPLPTNGLNILSTGTGAGDGVSTILCPFHPWLGVGGSAFVSSDGSPDWGYASWATDLIELYGEACERAIAEPDSVLLVADAQRCPV